MSSTNMSLNGQGPRSPGATGPAVTEVKRVGNAVIYQSQPHIPLSELLKEKDLVLLLTPAVAPDPSSATPHMDPFEPLGQAMAKFHPWIRHVPYLPRNGITGTHVVHLRPAAAVVFVISGPPRQGQPPQVAMAEIVRTLCEQRPQVIVACCDIQELGALETAFPAIIQIPNYSPLELENAARILFAEAKRPPTGPNFQNLLLAPRPWTCVLWKSERDLSAVFDLWCQCLPKRFHLDRARLQALLCRDGYAMHYVVREPETSEVVGFCAAYTEYASSDSERLIGSVAALLVRPSYRQRGVGLSLHNAVLNKFSKVRGVSGIQLGSSFPRLLYGLPMDSPWEDWFRRRDWPIKPRSSELGEGQEACDWLLRLEDWPAIGAMPPGLNFRTCEPGEFDSVLAIVSRESGRKNHFGWYDQYAKLVDTIFIRDIMLGLQGDAIVAIAITYSKNNGGPVGDDLPWADTIADDVGGVTCICIVGEYPLSYEYMALS